MVMISLNVPIEGEYVSIKKQNPIYKIYPYINTPYNIAYHLMYTLEFQTQRHYSTNLSLVAVLSEILR